MDFDHGDGSSSKYSRTDIQESDGSGSSKHSWRHLELDDEAGSSWHSRKRLEHLDTYPGGGIESNLFYFNPEVFDGIESSKHSEVIQEEIDRFEGDVLVSTEQLRLSSSSSSSGSSTDDRFQADIKLSESGSGITSTSYFKPDEHHVPGNNSSILEECQNGSAAGSTLRSQVSSVVHESTLTQSPPIQVMDRLGEFDPCRIPSAVFARSKSITPADWSIASNDSLFSIQVGNNSFSRDQIIGLKSGELFKSGEFIALSLSPVAPAVDTNNEKSLEFDKSEANVVSDDAVNDETGPSAEEPIGEKPTHPMVSWNSSTISNHSDDTGTSGQSFAFPVRKKKNNEKQKKCAWPSCYCSDCSRVQFCYCWNHSIKRCLEDGKNVYKEEKVEQQQQQQEEQPLAFAPVASKSACCSCSCFPSCRRRRWHCWHCCCSCDYCQTNCC